MYARRASRRRYLNSSAEGQCERGAKGQPRLNSAAARRNGENGDVAPSLPSSKSRNTRSNVPNRIALRGNLTADVYPNRRAPLPLIYYLGRSSPGSKNCGLRISDCGFRNPHSTIRNGLRAKPALVYYFAEFSRGARISVSSFPQSLGGNRSKLPRSRRGCPPSDRGHDEALVCRDSRHLPPGNEARRLAIKEPCRSHELPEMLSRI